MVRLADLARLFLVTFPLVPWCDPGRNDRPLVREGVGVVAIGHVIVQTGDVVLGVLAGVPLVVQAR